MSLILICLGSLVLAVAIIFTVNRFSVPAAVDAAVFSPPPTPEAPSDHISVATWNIGYAGMGAEADFVMDLGTQTRPLSADLVERNLDEITSQSAALRTDVIFVQESARPSFSTYQRDVQARLEQALPAYGAMYAGEVQTRLVPPPFATSIGNAVFSRLAVSGAERRALPLEPTFEYGAFRKGYRMHILRVGAAPEWVLVNIHLSTFDTAEDDVRRKQVAAVMAFAQAEYAAGRHVIIGGDWNLRLAATEFAHRTDPQYQFWIRDFPAGAIPDGWAWAVDPATPTVRTAHKPYVAGENYVLVVDGFLASPNIAVERVEALDLGFEFTDHHPVIARFRAKPADP